MAEKKCMKCGEIKPLSAFYKHPGMKDGHLNKCIECTKKDVANHKEQHPEKIFETRMKVFMKRKTRTSLYKLMDAALKAGVIKNPGVCSVCGCTSEDHRIEAHHEDYDKPLDIVWVCTPCHRKLDGERRLKEGLAPYGRSIPIKIVDKDGNESIFNTIAEAAKLVGCAPNTLSVASSKGFFRDYTIERLV